jgi:hypothetical protein
MTELRERGGYIAMVMGSRYRCTVAQTGTAITEPPPSSAVAIGAGKW